MRNDKKRIGKYPIQKRTNTSTNEKNTPRTNTQTHKLDFTRRQGSLTDIYIYIYILWRSIHVCIYDSE